MEKFQKLNTRRITRIAMFTALALIFSLLESMLPPLISVVPGAKMGLSNVVTLTAIIILGCTDAAIIQLVRCILGGIFSGGLSGLMFSLPAGFASLAVMIVLYKLVFPRLSLMGISFVSAVVHNLTQVMIAALIIDDFNFFFALPQYILAGIAAGLFVGIVTYFTIKYLPERTYLDTPIPQEN